MFTGNSPPSANRDAVASDLINLGARAQHYYRRAISVGGGGNSFVGLTADAAGFAKRSQRSLRPFRFSASLT